MRFIKYLFFIAMPSFGWYITFYWLVEENKIAIASCYMLTVLYIVLFVKFEPVKLFVLPTSFLITPLPLFIYETIEPDWFQYLATMFGSFYYTLPFTIVTTVIFIFLTLRKMRKMK